jgi:site-specific recombinase XerD
MEHVETLKPSTVNRYLLTVGTFYNWLAAEGVVNESPVGSVRLLRVREVEAPAVLHGDTMRSIADGAAVVKRGRTRFESVRDVALLALLQDTGLRASECAGLLLANVDLGARQAYVHADVAKGGWPRTVTFGFETARLLNRYLRARETHRYSFLPELFVGRRGPATYSMVHELVRTAARRGGVTGARPHLYRHSWAHDLKRQGVDLEVLMSLGGWRTTSMPLRYGLAERDARAVDAYQRIGSPVDRSTIGRAG